MKLYGFCGRVLSSMGEEGMNGPRNAVRGETLMLGRGVESNHSRGMRPDIWGVFPVSGSQRAVSIYLIQWYSGTSLVITFPLAGVDIHTSIEEVDKKTSEIFRSLCLSPSLSQHVYQPPYLNSALPAQVRGFRWNLDEKRFYDPMHRKRAALRKNTFNKR